MLDSTPPDLGPAAAAPAIGPVPTAAVSDTVEASRRIEIYTGMLSAGLVSVLEMGPSLARKGFGASDLEVTMVASGQSIGLLLAFVSVDLARRGSHVRLVAGLHIASGVSLLPVFFLRPGLAFAFVVLHALAQIAWALSIPGRIVVYRTNLPDSIRGRILGRVRQIQQCFVAIFALVLSTLLDWSCGEEILVSWFRESPFGPDQMLSGAIPLAGALAVISGAVFGAMPNSGRASRDEPSPGAWATLVDFGRVLRQDREFLRYQVMFFVFGFTNIAMTPLVAIHVVDELRATYFDLAMVDVIIVQATMAASLAWWGRRVDRHGPISLRAVLNMILAVDLIVLALAPSVEWVWFGRVFRGVAFAGGSLVWMLGPLHFARGGADPAVYAGIHSFLTGLRWLLAPFCGYLLRACSNGDARPIFGGGALILIGTAFAMFREARIDRGRPSRSVPGTE
jgi:hypothetical protein